MVVGALVGLAVMLVVWFAVGGERAGSFIGGVLLNMAVFGAMFSYLLQGLTFIQLRRRFPNIERPYRSPLGVLGAALTVIIALVTIINESAHKEVSEHVLSCTLDLSRLFENATRRLNRGRRSMDSPSGSFSYLPFRDFEPAGLAGTSSARNGARVCDFALRASFS